MINLYIFSCVLIIEITGVEWRELLIVLFQVPNCLAQIPMPILAYYLHSWRYLQFAYSIPSLLIVPFCWTLPESPRWLLNARKTTVAAAVLAKAAECNRLPTQTIEADIEAHAKLLSEVETPRRGNVFDLFCQPTIRRNTIFICSISFLVAFIYTGIMRLLADRHDSNIFWHLATDIFYQFPSIVFCTYSAIPNGSRKTLIISNLVVGVCMLLTLSSSRLQKYLAILAFVGASSSATTLWILICELNPTCVRNVGLALAHSLRIISTHSAPLFITFLNGIHLDLLPLLLAVLSLIVAQLVIFLPDSKRHPLPDTVEDAEELCKHCDCEWMMI